MRQLFLLLLLSVIAQCLCIENPTIDNILAEIEDLKVKAVQSDQRQRELEQEIARLNKKVKARFHDFFQCSLLRGRKRRSRRHSDV